MFPSLSRVVLPLLAVVVLSACGGSGNENAASGTGSSSGTSSSSSSSSSGTSSSSSSSSSSTSSSGANVASVLVGPGPTASSSFFNIPATTLKVCLPGTSTCQTISHVLVDTGSYGLRLLASALNGLITTAHYQQDPSTGGNYIVECLPFADGYTWGPVASVDLYIGGEKASGLPINIIDDSAGGTLEPAAPASCSSQGNNIGSVDNLGANGILGVGLFSYDCGGYCTQPVSEQNASTNFLYYSCSATVCSPTSEPLAGQVINPVAMFPVDNNGVVMEMEAVGDSGATTASGKLIFGIGTQSNNALGSATVLTTDDTGAITTFYKTQTLNGSFIDSGSNGLFFPDSSLAKCGTSGGAASFYCLSPTQSFSATNQGLNGNMAVVPFSIGDLNSFSNTIFAISDVGGPTTSISGLGSAYFDFGVPFFYGRTVFTGMDTTPGAGLQTTSQAPFVAY